MKSIISLLLLCICVTVNAQNPNKKTLGHEELVSWNRIRSSMISPDGNTVVYSLVPEEGNPTLSIWDANSNTTTSFERGKNAQISFDSKFVVFKLVTDWDSLRQMKREKVDKKKLPKDTLAIYNIATKELEKIANVKSFQLPPKWSGWLVYHKEIEQPQKDTTTQKEVAPPTESSPDSLQVKKKKPKKETKKTGTKLMVRNLSSQEETLIPFVKSYALAEEGMRVLAASTGKDSTQTAGVYVFDAQANSVSQIFEGEGEYKNLTFDQKGAQAAFHVNLDTTDMRVAPYGLAYWKNGAASATIIADTLSKILPTDWRVSENGKPSFSEDGSKLYFGTAPKPILQDTALLDEDIVSVEVWSYEDALLHTQQKVRLKDEKKRTYRAVWHIDQNKMVQLATEQAPETALGDEGNAPFVIGYNQLPYYKESSWEGVRRRDVYLINTENGSPQTIANAIEGSTIFSPDAQFVYWYNRLDSAWFSYELGTDKLRQITNNETVKFYREIHDTPSHPWTYGIAGWLEGDQAILIYDRYDIWKVDPKGQKAPINLTNSREQKLRYRYVRLDEEARAIDPSGSIFLHVFDEKTKGGGYASLNLKTGALQSLTFDGNYAFSQRPQKAQQSDKIIFSKQNFQTFPDLHYSALAVANAKQISDANPQQSEYSWGSVELYNWTDLNGNVLTGMLVKPENFDPNKKYPMIVNFYEKSSDRLHSHRTPLPGRSTINYPFYASKGYVIFNPDVPYRIGYPGESALNAVLSGVTSLIDKGFIDREKIGVQGHSWGGYQVSYLINRTDIFACAESGAPVVNMFSAYGGIRWGSGLSRMFQYEHTQSRIGGSIWEYPLRYLENSPIFTLDKCNTPVLILHNDKDGAVPWYQGIEYFVGLRRLNKPAWLLNYNDEPHWPVKLQNRKDFNIRMQQFFDYYLMDAPKPQWMERGVPAIEKGILQGLEAKE